MKKMSLEPSFLIPSSVLLSIILGNSIVRLPVTSFYGFPVENVQVSLSVS